MKREEGVELVVFFQSGSFVVEDAFTGVSMSFDKLGSAVPSPDSAEQTALEYVARQFGG